LPAIRSVLEKGAYLGKFRDIQSKDLYNFFFAAPIRINEKDNIVFVRIRQADGDKKRFYVHEVYTEDEIKKETETLQTADALKRLPHGVSVSSKSLIKDALDGKDVSKVVDKNGKPLIVYHWTKNDFDVFKNGDRTFRQISIVKTIGIRHSRQ
jgi:hypothetical protein